MTTGWTMRGPALLGAAILLAATGCATGDPETPITPSDAESTGASAAPVVLLAEADAPGSGDARVIGTLVDSDGCLAVQGPEVTYPAVWPAQTRWSGTGIVLPDGSNLDLGDEVDLGGSYTRELPAGVTPELPRGCAEADEFVIIDIGS